MNMVLAIRVGGKLSFNVGRISASITDLDGHLVAFSNAENEQGIFDSILQGHIDFSSDPWPSISNSAKDLVKKMLQQDPKERLTASEVLSKLQF